MLADRGLAKAQTVGGLGEAEGLGDGQEGAELRGVVHGAMLSLIVMTVRVVCRIPDHEAEEEDGEGTHLSEGPYESKWSS
ncbi:hypothetical protein GCM10009612_33510 [Streptomyces beijiangensis]